MTIFDLNTREHTILIDIRSWHAHRLFLQRFIWTGKLVDKLVDCRQLHTGFL